MTLDIPKRWVRPAPPSWPQAPEQILQLPDLNEDGLYVVAPEFLGTLLAQAGYIPETQDAEL